MLADTYVSLISLAVEQFSCKGVDAVLPYNATSLSCLLQELSYCTAAVLPALLHPWVVCCRNYHIILQQFCRHCCILELSAAGTIILYCNILPALLHPWGVCCRNYNIILQHFACTAASLSCLLQEQSYHTLHCFSAAKLMINHVHRSLISVAAFTVMILRIDFLNYMSFMR